MITLLIHPTCYTSYNLVKKLYEHKLLEGIELVDIAFDPSVALRYRALSVPAIIVNNNLVYAGPIDIDKTIRLLQEGLNVIRIEASIDEIVDMVVKTIADSFALSSIAIYNGVESVLKFKETIKAGIGLIDEEKLDKAISLINSNEKYKEKILNKAYKNIAYNIIRIIYWTYGKRLRNLRDLLEFLSLDHIALLIETSAIYGRIGLIHYRRKELIEKVKPVYSYITENFNSIYERITAEQDKIIFDDDYLKILKAKGLSTDYLEKLRLLLRT